MASIETVKVDGKLYVRASHLIQGIEDEAEGIKLMLGNPEYNNVKLQAMINMLEITANSIRDLVVKAS